MGKKLSLLATAIFLVILVSSPLLALGLVVVPAGQRFDLPNYGTYLSFSQDCTLTSSFRTGGSTWHFIDLTLNGVTSNLTISTINANVTINWVNFNGWINYTTAGIGQQVLVSDVQPSEVYLDSLERHRNDGWTYADGTLTVTGATRTVDVKYDDAAPTPTTQPTQTPISSPTVSPSPLPTLTPTLPPPTPTPTLSPTPTPTAEITVSPTFTVPPATPTPTPPTSDAPSPTINSPTQTPTASSSPSPSPSSTATTSATSSVPLSTPSSSPEMPSFSDPFLFWIIVIFVVASIGTFGTGLFAWWWKHNSV